MVWKTHQQNTPTRVMKKTFIKKWWFVMVFEISTTGGSLILKH
jgi:hypothetical protein